MMRKYLFSLLLVLSSLQCFAQRDHVWQLSYDIGPGYIQCGLDFSNGNPDTFSLVRPMEFYNTNTSISDTAGNLLFYTNGIFIANSNHDTLLNAQDFNPGTVTNNFSYFGLNIPQACLFIPFPDSDSLYFVFHESSELFVANSLSEQQPINLRYSIIDRSLDNGNGGIPALQKSIIVISDTLNYGKLAAVKHGNGRDWWIIAHRYYSDIFYKILITPDTISVSSQQIGSQIIYDVGGQAVFSSDGNKYSLLTQNHLLDIFDFDRCSGMLSNHESISVPDSIYGDFGCSISPNNRFLYVSNQLKIYQYDLNSSNIANSVINVAVWDTVMSPTPTLFFVHQLGPDGKIYIGTWGACDVMHVISQPDSSGMNCNVQQNYIKLPSFSLALPNYPNYNLAELPGSPCDSLTSTSLIDALQLQLSVSPNPSTSNSIAIKYSLKQNTPGVIKIYDTKGKVVYSYPLPPWSSYQNLTLPNLTSGIYLVRLESGERSRVVKFVRY